tara:strand:+ start:39 stop:887 length:849 start_codon:yes stop_codon:yes gene_type:complete
MPFNKIQPEQLQMPTFLGPSGDFHIDQSSDTGISLVLSRNLTGDFNFTGDITIRGKKVFGTASTGDNSFLVESGNLLLAGSNTQLAGRNNIGIVANSTRVSGINNVVLNGNSIVFNTGSESNISLGGAGVTFAKAATGCAAIKDQSSSTLTVGDPNRFYVQFASGHYFEDGQNYFGNNVSINDSGIVSGKFEIQTSGFLTGYDIATIHDVTGYTTGRFVDLSEDQTIHGIKDFISGFKLPAWEGMNMSQQRGAMAISGQTLCVSVGATWYGVGLSTPPPHVS